MKASTFTDAQKAFIIKMAEDGATGLTVTPASAGFPTIRRRARAIVAPGISEGSRLENNDVHSRRDHVGNPISPPGKMPAKGDVRHGPAPGMFNPESGRSK